VSSFFSCFHVDFSPRNNILLRFFLSHFHLAFNSFLCIAMQYNENKATQNQKRPYLNSTS
jgi:hypothetical protein